MKTETDHSDARIKSILSQINRLDDRMDEQGSAESAIYRSGIDPKVSWEKGMIEESSGVVLPSELSDIWDNASRINLYVDITHGHWGTIIWSPIEIIENQEWKSIRFYAEEDFQDGDLIVGEFPGNYDLALIVRCDENKQDFGTVIVASSMESRDEWNIVASSIIEFLEKIMEASGLMYWEPGFSFEKSLIEKWWLGDV